MKSEDYNHYLGAIKYALTIKDCEKRKEVLLEIKIRLIADYGLNDTDAKNLIKKC